MRVLDAEARSWYVASRHHCELVYVYAAVFVHHVLAPDGYVFPDCDLLRREGFEFAGFVVPRSDVMECEVVRVFVHIVVFVRAVDGVCEGANCLSVCLHEERLSEGRHLLIFDCVDIHFHSNCPLRLNRVEFAFATASFTASRFGVLSLALSFPSFSRRSLIFSSVSGSVRLSILS